VPVPVLCVGSHDGCLYAFDARTGALLRRLDLQRGAIFATPVPHRAAGGGGGRSRRDSRLLVATTAGWVVSVTLTLLTACPEELRLAVAWSRGTSDFAPVFATPLLVACPTLNGADISAPEGGADSKLCVAFCTVGGECLCLDAESGLVMWSLDVAASFPSSIARTPGGQRSSPVFSSPCAFPLARRVRPKDRRPPAAAAADETAADEDMATADSGGGSSSSHTVPDVGLAFGCHDGHIRFVSVQLGRVIWSADLGGAIFSSPAVAAWDCAAAATAAAAAASTVVVAATTSGELVALAVPTLYDDHHEEEDDDVELSSGVDGGGGASSVLRLDRVRLPGEVYSSPVVFTDHSSTTNSGHAAFVAVGCRDDSVYAFQLL
jgi:outer membrane protein assembly factor BamB